MVMAPVIGREGIQDVSKRCCCMLLSVSFWLMPFAASARACEERTRLMLIPVILNNKAALSVSKDSFAFLLASEQVKAFKRADGWVIVGCGKMRGNPVPYRGREKRNQEVYAKNYWR